MKKLIAFIVSLLVFAAVQAQNTRTVTGRVVFAGDDEPLPGATVIPADGTTGVITDVDGNFSISVATTVKKLRISYVGMLTREVDITGQPIVVKLSSADNQLNEVVVTALGMKRERKGLGYAVQDLNAEDLNTDGTTSLASAMQGKLTGVDIRPSSGAPGASAQIIIRGARSFDGNNQPLYVVDGMPVESTPDYGTGNSVTGANLADRSIDINPEDIESINVLKGQAASALYGIRASNGVIVITTKRGKFNSNKPTVTVSTNLSAEVVSRKFQRQDVYAQGNFIEGGYAPTSSMSWGPKIADLPNDPKYGGNGNGHDGMYYNPKRELAGLDGWTTPEIYDNVGNFFNTGFTENTNFSLSQRTERASYSFGLNNSYQEGIVPSTGMNRWSARGLVDWTIDKQWKTGFSGNYSSTKINSAPGANDGIMNVVYSAPSEYDLKGIPFHVPGDPTQQVLFRSTSFNNPYWWANNNEYLQHTNRFFGNAYVEFSPDLGLADNMKLWFREQAGIDMYTSNYSDIKEVGSAGQAQGGIENYGVSRNVFNNLFTANFTAEWGEFNFDAMLGNEINQDNSRWWDYIGNNFNFYGMPVIANATSFSSSEYNRHSRTVGFFGSAGLSWRSMLFLTVTGRNDYVSTMPRNNRSFFYPSVSLGWVFTELPSLKGNDVLTFGKLRASYAQVGQAGTFYENYYYVPGYSSGMYQYNPVTYPVKGVSSYVPYYVVYDKNLKPQNTENVEVGADFRLFRDRVRLEYTLSYQNVTDQIFSVPTAGSSGYQYKMTNAGKMRTWSHELGINVAILENKDYDLNLGINFTKVNNKVVELAEGVESIMLGGFVEPQIRAQAGNTYPNIYGTAFKRDEATGQLLLLDGLPQGTSDSQDLGNCSPDFVTGFTLSGRYRRVNLSTTWSWQKGGRMYHGTNLTLNYFGATKESLPFHEGTMVAEGIDEATGQPNTVEVSKQDYFMMYNDVTEAGVYDMSFFKLRDVTLTYKLPSFGKFDIEVFGFARNVLLWTNLPNFDPEASQGNGNMGGYFERFSIPNTSSYGGGLKFTF